MAVQDTLYPLEFLVASTPLSLQASARSKRRWKEAVAEAARQRIRATDDRDVERVAVQKFDPLLDWSFIDPSEILAAALDEDPPVVYICVSDDLG